jgi:hypothetical protein
MVVVGRFGLTGDILCAQGLWWPLFVTIGLLDRRFLYLKSHWNKPFGLMNFMGLGFDKFAHVVAIVNFGQLVAVAVTG